MTSESHAYEEGGTVLEPIPQSVSKATAAAVRGHDGTREEATAAGRTLNDLASSSAEGAYRPEIRPLVPKLVILDDGEQAVGETHWLREQATVIGRSEGDIRLSHDPLVSGRHAELVREGTTRPHRWLLRDLGSANGTFVRCARTALRTGGIIILGSRRFRFRPPHANEDAEAELPNGTVMADVAGLNASAWPALVETTQSRDPLEIILSSPDLSLGRPGHQNAIEIDDPLLAAKHARIRRRHSGQWMLEALPSVNGIWVQIQAIALAPVSRFQVGEQRFLFVLPVAQ
jgi:pSer/pThr/pTyr-binding forkhead associated (FHA) protein